MDHSIRAMIDMMMRTTLNGQINAQLNDQEITIMGTTSGRFPTGSARGISSVRARRYDSNLQDPPVYPPSPPPISAKTCSKCRTSGLHNFREGASGEVVCEACFVEKTCADCGGKDMTEVFTSQRDERDICGVCFSALKSKNTAREKGFRLNGKVWVDPEMKKKQEISQLRERRVQNSMTHAQGLRDDPDLQVTTKTKAAKLMRKAGCRYVSEALKRVSFTKKTQDSEPGWTPVGEFPTSQGDFARVYRRNARLMMEQNPCLDLEVDSSGRPTAVHLTSQPLVTDLRDVISQGPMHDIARSLNSSLSHPYTVTFDTLEEAGVDTEE